MHPFISAHRLEIVCLLALGVAAEGVLGCATPGPKSPRPGVYRFKISQVDWTELYKGEGFTILKGPWFDPEYFQRKQDEVVELLRAHNYPVERDRALLEQSLHDIRGMEVYMQKETRAGRAAYLILGVILDDKVTLRITGRGALMIDLTMDSTIVRELDQGLLLCPKREHGRWLDTAKGPVTFSRGFDSRPDYRDQPNLMFVRLPPTAYERPVVGLSLDPRRLAVTESAR